MFYDIFNKKTKEKKYKPNIIIDIHEKNSLIFSELVSNNNINLEIKSLEIGDYLINDIIIERKTTSDFVSSMISKRLFKQLNQMRSYEKKILIIEENEKKDFSKINKRSIKGCILSIILKNNIPIIFTKNYLESAEYLVLLAFQQKNSKKVSSIHPRIPLSLNDKKRYILEAFPNIGRKRSSDLIKKFRSLKNIFNANKEELHEIIRNESENFINILEDTNNI
jgi:ERCC4-type nuclease